MKRQLVLALIISTAALAGPVSAQETRGPKIEVRELQHDFGKVVQQSRPSHVFEIHNAGNEPLVIDRIQPS